MTDASRVSTSANIDSLFRSMLREVADTHPCHVLYLEDDSRAALQVKSLFKEEPVIFLHARSAEEASVLLKQYPIDIVVVDIWLGEGGLSGEQWIVENEADLADCTVCVLTGRIAAIKDPKRLSQVASVIIRKGDPEHRQLWKRPSEIAFRRAAGELGQRASVILDKPGEEVETSEGVGAIGVAAVSLFKKWAEKLGPEEVGLIIGNREFSINDLVDEVETGTGRGQRLLRIFLEDMEDYL